MHALPTSISSPGGLSSCWLATINVLHQQREASRMQLHRANCLQHTGSTLQGPSREHPDPMAFWDACKYMSTICSAML